MTNPCDYGSCPYQEYSGFFSPRFCAKHCGENYELEIEEENEEENEEDDYIEDGDSSERPLHLPLAWFQIF